MFRTRLVLWMHELSEFQFIKMLFNSIFFLISGSVPCLVRSCCRRCWTNGRVFSWNAQSQYRTWRCYATQYKTTKKIEYGRVPGQLQWQILHRRAGCGRIGQIGLLQWHCGWCCLLSNRHGWKSTEIVHHDVGLFISVQTTRHRFGDGEPHFELCQGRW